MSRIGLLVNIQLNQFIIRNATKVIYQTFICHFTITFSVLFRLPYLQIINLNVELTTKLIFVS